MDWGCRGEGKKHQVWPPPQVPSLSPWEMEVPYPDVGIWDRKRERVAGGWREKQKVSLRDVCLSPEGERSRKPERQPPGQVRMETGSERGKVGWEPDPQGSQRPCRSILSLGSRAELRPGLAPWPEKGDVFGRAQEGRGHSTLPRTWHINFHFEISVIIPIRQTREPRATEERRRLPRSPSL